MFLPELDQPIESPADRSPAPDGACRARSYAAATVALLVIATLTSASSSAADGSRRTKLRAVHVILAEQSTGRYYDQVIRGAEHAAKRVNPAVRFTAVSSKNDPDVQTAQVEQAIRNRTDLLVIQRTYAGDGSAAIQRARAAGIVVVAIDADVPGGTDAVVKPDEYQGGVLAARFVARQLAGKGKVAIADGPATAAPIQLRVAGFRNGLRTFPAIEIVDDQNTAGTRDGARQVMRKFLAQYPGLDAVFAVNDPIATYCESEAVHQQRTSLFIVGMEGSPASVAAMKSSGHLIAASPGEDPFAIAETAVNIGVDIIRGHRPAHVEILVPFVELSRANVNNYRGWTHEEAAKHP